MPLTLDELNHHEDSVGDGFRSLDFGFLPEIDSSSMSARFRICTPRQDREGDIIEPSGVDWEDYRWAPVVKYEHGFTGIPFPVARSADDNGHLHVEYNESEDAIYARAFFSESNELSSQMFGLVDEGLLRAASIHVIPEEGGFRSLGGDGHHVFYSNMLEWSLATVGMNPDSYLKSLSRDSKFSEFLNLQLDCANRILGAGSVGGRQLLPVLAKCLKSIQPPKRPLVRGSSATSEGDTVAKKLTRDAVDKMSVAEFTKALGNRSDYDAATKKIFTARAKSFSLPKMDDETDESLAKMAGELPGEEEDIVSEDSLAKADDEALADEAASEPAAEVAADATGTPPGASFISAAHSDLSRLAATFETASSVTENPAVIEMAAEWASGLREMLMAIEGGYGSAYPDETPLVGEAADADVEMVKAWVADKSTRSFQLAGLANRLTAAAKNPAKAKALIQQTVHDLRMLNTQAKSWKPKQSRYSDDEVDALLAKCAKLIEYVEKRPAQV